MGICYLIQLSRVIKKYLGARFEGRVKKPASILVLVLAFTLLNPRLALGAEGDGPGPSSGPRRHLATIVFSGLGGAVIGLSTLSFYGRPQDKLGNIGVGFAVGIIAGTAYVTYQIVKSPNEFYSLNSELPVRVASDHELWSSPSDPTYFEPRERRRLPPTLSVANFNWSF